MSSALDVAKHIALQHESRIVCLPRLVMSHFDCISTQELGYNLVNLGVGKLGMVNLTSKGEEAHTCLPMQVRVPAPKTSIALSMARYDSSLSSHLSGRNSYGSSPKTQLESMPWTKLQTLQMALQNADDA